MRPILLIVALSTLGGASRAAPPPPVSPLAPLGFTNNFNHIDPALPLTLRDGPRSIQATRLPHHRVHLAYPDGRTATARVTPSALALDLRPADAARLGLAPPIPLMPAAGITRVRSLDPAEDGLALASRLAETIAIFPDLAFTHAPTAALSPLPPNDPLYDGQWYLDRIAIESAWRLTSGAASVTVAVVDDGCDLAHPELATQLDPGRDLVDDDADPSFLPHTPMNAHGTSCAGLVGAISNNSEGMAGICPSCRLRCVRLLPGGAGGEVPLSADIEAFAQQLAWGVAVSSNSWGFTDRFPVPIALKRAIATLASDSRAGLGAVVVFAAGNDAREIFPDELYGIEGVVTVGAINGFDEAASFSNFGTPVDLTAPAGTLTLDISGADGDEPGDYTHNFGGTSSAAPIVAGVAALAVAHAPDRPAAEIVAALRSTARPAPFATPDATGHDPVYGFGIVAPAELLEALRPAPSVADDPAQGDASSADSTPSGEADVSETTETFGDRGPAPARSDAGCQGGPEAEFALLAALLVVRRQRRPAA